MSEQRKLFVVALAVWLFAALDACWMGWSQLPCPRGVDDAFYKSPAAELVQTGSLTQPAVKGYLPRAEEIFAAYPPLYQLVVAAWFWVFGISTGASVAFSHVVHLLNMAAIMALVSVALRPIVLPFGLRAFAVCAPGVVYFGILRFFDRQEELAVLLGFVEITLFLLGRLSGVGGASVTGILVGLSAVISPWTGVVLAGMVGLREVIAWWRGATVASSLVRLAAIVFCSAVPSLVWVCWLSYAHPGSVSEVFLYHLRVSEYRTLMEAPRMAIDSLLIAPYALPALVFTLFFLPRFVIAEARTVPTGVVALFLASVASLVFVVITRVNSYNYIWLCLFLLIPCFGYLGGRLFAEAKPAERAIPIVIVSLCVLASLRDPVSLSLVAHDLPAAERPGPIFAQLAAAVPPGEHEVVGTTSRHWYVFQGRNPWRVTGILPHLDANERKTWVKWIVLPVDHMTPEMRDQMTEGFELIEKTPSGYSTFAPTFMPGERTWAYELYRRREEKPPPP